GPGIARRRVLLELVSVGPPPAAGHRRPCPPRPRAGVMACGARLGPGAPAGTGPKAARVTSRLARVWPWVLAAGVAAAAAVRAPRAAGEVRALLGHPPGLPLP